MPSSSPIPVQAVSDAHVSLPPPLAPHPSCPSRWFHGKITREQAERLLYPPETGLFLVRESTNYPGDYTLCVSCDSKVEHYRIIYHNGKLSIDEEEYFGNLMQLVEVRDGGLAGPMLARRVARIFFVLFFWGLNTVGSFAPVGNESFSSRGSVCLLDLYFVGHS